MSQRLGFARLAMRLVDRIFAYTTFDIQVLSLRQRRVRPWPSCRLGWGTRPLARLCGTNTRRRSVIPPFPKLFRGWRADEDREHNGADEACPKGCAREKPPAAGFDLCSRRFGPGNRLRCTVTSRPGRRPCLGRPHRTRRRLTET